MDELARWLGEQLDEDGRIARAAAAESEEHWSPGDKNVSDSVNSAEYGSPVVIGPYEYLDWAIREHIAEWDPARALREIDSKRQLLTLHRPYVAEPGQACLGCAGGIEWETCPVVRLLALPYADRPGYQDEWRP